MFHCLRAQPKVLFLDDDETFLGALSSVVPEHLRPSFAAHPSEADGVLSEQGAVLLSEQQMLMPVTDGESSLVAARSYLEWLARQDAVSVLVSDQSMPAETGVSFCSRHSYDGLSRILLTGAADADLAVQAFNAGAIEQFLPKSAPRMAASLLAMIALQHEEALRVRGRRIYEGLPERSRRLLDHPALSEALDAHVVRLRLTGAVMVGEPFGLLGMSDAGQLYWLQIETADSLKDLALLMGEIGASGVSLKQVCNGEVIPAVEVSLQLQGGRQPLVTRAESLGDGVFLSCFVLEEVG